MVSWSNEKSRRAEEKAVEQVLGFLVSHHWSQNVLWLLWLPQAAGYLELLDTSTWWTSNYEWNECDHGIITSAINVKYSYVIWSFKRGPVCRPKSGFLISYLKIKFILSVVLSLSSFPLLNHSSLLTLSLQLIIPPCIQLEYFSQKSAEMRLCLVELCYCL